MRADRLISILLLLQTQGRFSAQQLAKELEVCERTIYRDITALNQAGIPVYTIKGPGGGIFLVENYRTTLTGLTDEQLQALFMLNIPQPLVQLGAGEALKTALLKLAAASPASRFKEDEASHQRFYLDWESEPYDDHSIAFLEMLKQAVWQDHRLRMTHKPHFWAVVQQVIEPFGLIARGNTWYLAYSHENHIQALKIDSIIDAEILEDHFIRPLDFNLGEFWHHWLTQTTINRPTFHTQVRISPALARQFPRFMGKAAQQAMQNASLPDQQGWITLDLTFDTLESARSRLLAFGGAVEVLEPQALRLSIADFAQQTIAAYAPKSDKL